MSRVAVAPAFSRLRWIIAVTVLGIFAGMTGTPRSVIHPRPVSAACSFLVDNHACPTPYGLVTFGSPSNCAGTYRVNVRVYTCGQGGPSNGVVRFRVSNGNVTSPLFAVTVPRQPVVGSGSAYTVLNFNSGTPPFVVNGLVQPVIVSQIDVASNQHCRAEVSLFCMGDTCNLPPITQCGAYGTAVPTQPPPTAIPTEPPPTVVPTEPPPTAVPTEPPPTAIPTVVPFPTPPASGSVCGADWEVPGDDVAAAWQFANGRANPPTNYDTFGGNGAIAAAVQFAQAAAFGDVRVEPGIFNEASIAINGNNLRIVGSGGRPNDASQTVINFSANQSGPGGHLAGFLTTAGVSNLLLRDFVIQGATQAGMDLETSNGDIWCHTVKNASAVGVRIEDAMSNTLHELTVQDSGGIGIELSESDANHLYVNAIERSADAGIMLQAGSDGNLVGVAAPNNVAESGNHGITVQDSVGNVVKDNMVIIVTGGDGINVTNAASANTIDNNSIHTVTAGSGVLIDNADGQVVMNNGISNVAVDGIALTTLQEGGHGCTGCQILLNGIGTAGRAGISLGKNSDSNQLLFNNIGVWQGVAPLADGIHLTQDSDANTLDSNTVQHCGSDGLAIEDNSDGNIVMRNHLEYNLKDGLVIKLSFGNQIGNGDMERNFVRWNANSGIAITDNADNNVVTRNDVTCNNQSNGSFAGIGHNFVSNDITKNAVQHTPIQIAIVPLVPGNTISSCGQ